jgi:hypothetical protein
MPGVETDIEKYSRLGYIPRRFAGVSELADARYFKCGAASDEGARWFEAPPEFG